MFASYERYNVVRPLQDVEDRVAEGEAQDAPHAGDGGQGRHAERALAGPHHRVEQDLQKLLFNDWLL